MVERRRTHKLSFILYFVLLLMIGSVGVWFYVKNKDDVGTMVIDVSNDLKLEKDSLNELLQTLKDKGIIYKDTNDIDSEQFIYDMVSDVLGNVDACNWAKYANNDLIDAYCALSGKRDNLDGDGVMTAEDPVLIEDVVPEE